MNDTDKSEINPKSKDLVIGLVGYAGAGCTNISEVLRDELEAAGYSTHFIKLSQLIIDNYKQNDSLKNKYAIEECHTQNGNEKLIRATTLQDIGDDLRELMGSHIVASYAIKKIQMIKNPNRTQSLPPKGADASSEGDAGVLSPQDPVHPTPPETDSKPHAFILDSIKHYAEVERLREVYGKSFRLISVHCERATREGRLIGGSGSQAKYKNAKDDEVKKYIKRDEGDSGKPYGQQVRASFYRGDYFIDNNKKSTDITHLHPEIKRFVNIIVSNGLVRPTKREFGMYQAYSASLQSACLSRQVGAALESKEEIIVSTGSNDVPKFGGGVYGGSDDPDNRCYNLKFSLPGATESDPKQFTGCHNDRYKTKLRNDISEWLKSNILKWIKDHNNEDINEMITKAIDAHKDDFEKIPGIKDIIEYSRAIHAEMNALFQAARQGVSLQASTLYCTTFPCHNCARHLVVAGVRKVYYIEPYTKSLAVDLHGDSIETISDAPEKQTKMIIAPFFGVGPRMFVDAFQKNKDLKKSEGYYNPEAKNTEQFSVRLSSLSDIQDNACNF